MQRVQRNSLKFNIDRIMGNELTNIQEIMKGMYNNEHQLYFAVVDSRKKRMERRMCVCAAAAQDQYFM